MRWPLYVGLALVVACGDLARSASTAPDASSADAGARFCAPAQSIVCVGPGGCDGAQTCDDDGSSYLPCECEATVGSSSGASADSGPETGSSSGTDSGSSGNTIADSGEESGSGRDDASDFDGDADSGPEAGVGPDGDAALDTGPDVDVDGGPSDDANTGSDAPSEDTGTGVPDEGGGTAVTSAMFFMYQTCTYVNAATLLVTLDGSAVGVQRNPIPGGGDQDTCSYAGTLNTDCDSVAGTYACTSGSGTWSATFVGQSNDGGCSLGTTWSEHEAFPGTSGCDATWTQEGGAPLSN